MDAVKKSMLEHICELEYKLGKKHQQHYIGYDRELHELVNALAAAIKRLLRESAS